MAPILRQPKLHELTRNFHTDHPNSQSKQTFKKKSKVEQAILEEYPFYYSENQVELFNEPLGKTKDIGSYYYFGNPSLNLEDHKNHSSSNNFPNKFPESFKPRKAANMKLEEKVLNWIESLPSRLDSDYQIVLDCFPAITSYTSSNSELSQMDLTDFDEILEIQARRVTRYATRIYLHEVQPTSDLIDESLEYYENGNYSEFNESELLLYSALNSQLQS